MGHLKFSCMLCNSKPGPRFNTERHIWTRHVRTQMGPNYNGAYYEPAEHKKLVIKYMSVLEAGRGDEAKSIPLQGGGEYNWHNKAGAAPTTLPRQPSSEAQTNDVKPLPAATGDRVPAAMGDRLRNIYHHQTSSYSQRQRATSEPYPQQQRPAAKNTVDEKGYDLAAVLAPSTLAPNTQVPLVNPNSFGAHAGTVQYPARRQTTTAALPQHPEDCECVGCLSQTMVDGSFHSASNNSSQTMLSYEPARSHSDPGIFNYTGTQIQTMPVSESVPEFPLQKQQPQEQEWLATGLGRANIEGFGDINTYYSSQMGANMNSNMNTNMNANMYSAAASAASAQPEVQYNYNVNGQAHQLLPQYQVSVEPASRMVGFTSSNFEPYLGVLQNAQFPQYVTKQGLT